MTARREATALPVWIWPWCLFLFLIPFQSVIDQLTLSLGYNLIGLAAGVMLALSKRGQAIRANWRTAAVAFLVAALSVSYFFSVDAESTREALTPIGATWVIYALATLTPLSQREFETGLRAWLWGGTAAACCSVVAFMHGSSGVDGRATLLLAGTETDPNFLVASLLVPFALSLHLIARKDRRIEGLLTGTMLVVVTLLTQSRSGVLGLLTVVLASLLLRRRWKTLLILGMLVVGAYAAFAPELGRFDLASDPTGAGRTDTWHVAIKAGFDHPATGIGLNALSTLTGSAPGLYWQREAHNTYLQAFAEAGMPGLLGLLLVFVTHLSGRAKHPLALAMRSSLLALLVTGLFLHLLTFKLLWAAWMVAAQAEGALTHDPSRATTLQKTLPPAHPHLIRE